MPRIPQNPLTVPPRPMTKFRVREKIAGGGSDRLAGKCVVEMQQLLTCLKNHSYNEKACPNEVGSFVACYNRHYENHMKKGGTEGTGKAYINQINALLKRFPERQKGK